MRKTLFLAAFMAASPLAAFAQSIAPSIGNGSQAVSTTPATIFSAASVGRPRNYLWLANVSPAGSPSIWCSDVGTPAANTAGSYEIAVGTANGRELRANAGFAPQGAITCVAASGTLQLTAEAN